MNEVRKAYQPCRLGHFLSRPVLTGQLLAGLLLLAAAPAEAAQCPSGQIYRVSKKICMDRAEAVKLGIIHSAARKTAEPPKAELAPKAEPAPEQAPAAAAPDSSDAALAAAAAEPAAAPAAPPPAARPSPPPASAPSPPPAARPSPPPASAPSPPPAATPSPFGGLTIENFSKP